MRFSPFNPILFMKAEETIPGHGGYVRTFAESDCVMLEVFAAPEEPLPEVEVYDMDRKEMIGTLPFKGYGINSCERMGLLERSGFTAGHYRFMAGAYVSECVRIIPDDDIDGTVLMQYAYSDSRQRTDVMTKVFSGIRYFSLRFHGGFKDSGWVFKVDNDQFVSPDADPVELSAWDYTDKTLTVGSPSGVDVRTAGLVNRILLCPLVFIGGHRYARSEGAAFERTATADEDLAVYSVLLREARCLSPRMESAIRLNLRRTPEEIRGTGEKLRRYV